MKESKKQDKKLYQIEYNEHNWSWLLNSNKHDVSPAVPRDEPSTKDVARSTFDAARGRLVKRRLRPRRKRDRLRLRPL